MNTPEIEFSVSDGVFIGCLVNVKIDSLNGDPLDLVYKVTFSVDTSWKGIQLGQVSIWTDYYPGSCGYTFELDTTYLVYAYHWIDSLGTNICSRTRKLSEAQEDLEYLNNLNSLYTSAIQKPKYFSLLQNYPNPFNSETKIKYSLQKADFVKLKIYNLHGKEIQNLINEFQNIGKYSITFNAGDLASGVYFYKLKVGSVEQNRKMILLQ